MIEIILWTAIVLAVIFAVARKIKNIKQGKLCDCGCENCPSKCKEFKN